MAVFRHLINFEELRRPPCVGDGAYDDEEQQWCAATIQFLVDSLDHTPYCSFDRCMFLPSLFLYALFDHEDDGICKNCSTILHHRFQQRKSFFIVDFHDYQRQTSYTCSLEILGQNFHKVGVAHGPEERPRTGPCSICEEWPMGVEDIGISFRATSGARTAPPATHQSMRSHGGQ